MKRLLLIFLLCPILFIQNNYGQQVNYTSIQYAVSFGTGNTSDYISQTSFRGAVFEYRAVLVDNIMCGADIAWNVFYNKVSNGTYTLGTESLSGTQYRYQNSFPILFSADYLLSTDAAFKPYAGLGIGTLYSIRNTDMNLYTREINAWQFAIKPEIGFLFELSPSSSIKMAAKYYNGFNTNKLENQGYFSLSAGFVFH